MEYYTIEDIKRLNKEGGKYFFSPDTMRFFRSRVGDTVYQGQGGIFFVTSEQFATYSPHYRVDPRKYTVRQFIPESGDVETVSEYNELSRSQAHRLAKKYALEGVPA